MSCSKMAISQLPTEIEAFCVGVVDFFLVGIFFLSCDHHGSLQALMANEQERREMVTLRFARRSRKSQSQSQIAVGNWSSISKGVCVKAVSQSVCFAADDVAKHKNKIKKSPNMAISQAEEHKR